METALGLFTVCLRKKMMRYSGDSVEQNNLVHRGQIFYEAAVQLEATRVAQQVVASFWFFFFIHLRLNLIGRNRR